MNLNFIRERFAEVIKTINVLPYYKTMVVSSIPTTGSKASRVSWGHFLFLMLHAMLQNPLFLFEHLSVNIIELVYLHLLCFHQRMGIYICG